MLASPPLDARAIIPAPVASASTTNSHQARRNFLRQYHSRRREMTSSRRSSDSAP